MTDINHDNVAMTLLRQMQQEEHLGDGLYASFDGVSIKLRAPRGDEDHEVYLEPQTLIAFENYTRKLMETVKNATEVHKLGRLIERTVENYRKKADMGVDAVGGGQGPVDGTKSPG